jgi:hypothetical protein
MMSRACAAPPASDREPAVIGSAFRTAATLAAALALSSSCYPAPPYENPLTPDQVRTLRVKEIGFLPHRSGDSSAADFDLYRRSALRSAACNLGNHFDRSAGTARLTFRVREFRVRRTGGNISVASALSARIEGPGLKGDYSLGLLTDARTNVPNPPSVAEQARSQAAAIIDQLLSLRGEAHPREKSVPGTNC